MRIESKQYSGPCSCGQQHELETEGIIIEAGCLREARNSCRQYGLNGYTVAVYDENTYAATADRHPGVELEIILDPNGLHADEHGVVLLQGQLPENVDVILAIGAGTIHDLTRYCAKATGAAFVSCPTAASVDGFCSSVAAMTWHGCKRTLPAVAPKLVLADLEIIQDAPKRLTRFGFGDMVGKYIALTEWKIAALLSQEFYCERIAEMMRNALQIVMENTDGVIQGQPKGMEALMSGLLLSGLAMQMAGNSRPASGAEHHISHLIEMTPFGLGEVSDALHGEKVGVGTLLVLREYKQLCRKQKADFRDYSVWRSQDLEQFFDQDMVLELQEENRMDTAAEIKKEILESSWKDICRLVEELPSEEELRRQYERLKIV